MFTDTAAEVGIFVRDRLCGCQGGPDPGISPVAHSADRRQLTIDRPGKIDCGRSCCFEFFTGCNDSFHKAVCRRVACGDVHPIAGSSPDQARPAYVHLPDRTCYVVDGSQILDDKAMGKRALVNDLYDVRIIFL